MTLTVDRTRTESTIPVTVDTIPVTVDRTRTVASVAVTPIAAAVVVIIQATTKEERECQQQVSGTHDGILGVVAPPYQQDRKRDNSNLRLQRPK
jgi:hypothetical protein